MPNYYSTTEDYKKLSETTTIPKEILDVPQIISEKQSRKLWSRPLIINSKKPNILEALQEFQEVNRSHEQLVSTLLKNILRLEILGIEKVTIELRGYLSRSSIIYNVCCLTSRCLGLFYILSYLLLNTPHAMAIKIV